MIGRRVTRFFFILFELVRFAAVSALVSALASRLGWAGTLQTAFAAPQALFVLIVILYWYDPARYDAFRPLYTAGKAFSVCALAAAFGAALPEVTESASPGDSSTLYTLAAAGGALIYDFATAAVVAFSCLRVFLRNEPESSAGLPAAAERPVMTVDVLPDEKGEA